jgi:hypothetical protein
MVLPDMTLQLSEFVPTFLQVEQLSAVGQRSLFQKAWSAALWEPVLADSGRGWR